MKNNDIKKIKIYTKRLSKSSYFIVLPFLLMHSINLFTQEVIWEKKIFLDTLNNIIGNYIPESRNYLMGKSVIENNEGNILVSADFLTPGPPKDKLKIPYAGSALFKFDSQGNILWHYLFVKDTPLLPHIFFQNETGTYIFIGLHSLYAFADYWYAFVPFVAKFTPLSNTPFYEYSIDLQDSNILGEIFYSSYNLLTIDNSSNIVYCSFSANSKIRDTLFLVQFNSDGKFLSFEPIDTLETNDSIYTNCQVFQNNLNEYFFIGVIMFYYEPPGKKLFLIKTDQNLKKIYKKYYELTTNEIVISRVFAERYIYIITKTPDSLFIWKFEHNGDLVYRKILNFGKSMTISKCIEINGKNLLCSGYNIIYDNNRTYYIPHLVQINQNGIIDLDYIPPINLNLDYVLTSLCTTSDGHILVTGRISDSLYLAKIKIPILKIDDEQEQPFFEIYPFPLTADGNSIYIKFYLGNPIPIELEIYNTLGSCLQSIKYDNVKIGENFINIPLLSQNSSVYFVKLKTNGKILEIKPFVIVR